MPSWDGSSLSGWTVSGAIVDSGIGNPAPSFQAAPHQYAYTNASQIASTTVEFDVYIDGASVGLCDFFFGCDASGNGWMVRIDSRAGNICGVAQTTSWTSWGGPSGSGPVAAVTTWQHCKLIVNPAGSSVDFYFAGSFVATYAITVKGPYIGIQGDGGANGGHFDNITVTPYVVAITAPQVTAPQVGAAAGAQHQIVKAPAAITPAAAGGATNTGYIGGGGSGGSSGGGGSFTPGGDLSGSSTIQTVVGLQSKPLDAATIGAPADGQVITYNAASGKYKAATLPAPPASFVAAGDLAGSSSSQTVVGLDGKPLDASVGAPANGQVVQYDSALAKWKAATLPAPPAAFTASGDLSGTPSAQTVVGLQSKPLDAATIGAPISGQVIQYDGPSGKYKAATLPVATISFLDLHANRTSALAAANPNALYFESDRGNVGYESHGGVWVWVCGEYVALAASRPSDLGPNDAGFRFLSSDTVIRSQWSGTAWSNISTTDWPTVIRSTGTGSPPASGTGVEVSYAPGGPFGVISSYNRGASTYQSLHVNGNPLLLNIDAGTSAYVGIGTSAPAAMLDVVGVVRSQGFVAPTTGSGVEIEYSGGTGFLQSVNRSAGSYVPLKIEANPTTINATTAANVGIGVASPQARLHSTGSTIVGSPNSQLVAVANMGNSQVQIWINEAATPNMLLTFVVKTSGGATKTGTVTLS